MIAKLIPLVTLLLAACATADPYGQAGKDATATVQGTSNLETWIPFYDTSSTIDTVDDKPVGMASSTVLLPAGRHAFKVSCQVKGALDEIYTGSQTLSMDLVAGHQYKFVPQDPSEGSLTHTAALLDVHPSELEKFVLGMSRNCTSYAYDLTTGSRPDQQLVGPVQP